MTAQKLLKQLTDIIEEYPEAVEFTVRVRSKDNDITYPALDYASINTSKEKFTIWI